MVETLVLVMLVAGVLSVLVVVPRIDGDARELVTVMAPDFATGELPPVCAKPGRPATVGVAVGRRILWSPW